MYSGDNDWILVYGKGAENADLDFWKDSLKLRKAIPLEDFDQYSEKIYLLGNQFKRDDLYPFREAEVRWIKPNRHGLISDISWKGYLRKGERQRLSFSVFSENPSGNLRLGGIEGVEKSLNQGWNQGVLEFPIAGLGKVEQPLILESDTLAFLRFYIGPASPKHYQFIAGFPNPELRNLSQWLRNKGERVTEEIQLSRDTQLKSLESTDSLQVIFLDAGSLWRKDIQELVKKGQAALVVWNLSNPSESVQMINRLFGTDFQLEKTTQESSRVLDSGAEAFPFSFQEKNGQKLLLQDSWAVQFPFGKPVAVSLLSSTFPLFLQGSEQDYESIWGKVIGELEPEEEKSWRVTAPFLRGIGKKLEINQQDSLPSELLAFGDTIYLNSDPVNPHLAKGEMVFDEEGWIPIANDLEIFSYASYEFPALFSAAYLHEIDSKSGAWNPSQKESRQTISPWIWLIGMLLSLGMLWLEPKLDY